MELIIAIVVDVLLCCLSGRLLWGLRKHKRLAKLDAEIIDEQAEELGASQTIMHLQSHVIYDQAVQLHGRAAADRAIKNAHDRGTN